MDQFAEELILVNNNKDEIKKVGKDSGKTKRGSEERFESRHRGTYCWNNCFGAVPSWKIAYTIVENGFLENRYLFGS